MKSFLAIDCETTGLDSATDNVIEVGYALFDIELKRIILAGGEYINRVAFSDKADDRINFSDEIRGITHIERPWLASFGSSAEYFIERILDPLDRREDVAAVVAHNAAFDRAFLKNMGWNPGTPWICTQNDLPGNIGNKSLRYLALDRSVLSFFPHRAMFDAIQTGAILNTFDFDEVLVRSQSPTVILAADVTFKEKSKAKKLDFRWERPQRHGDILVNVTRGRGVRYHRSAAGVGSDCCVYAYGETDGHGEQRP